MYFKRCIVERPTDAFCPLPLIIPVVPSLLPVYEEERNLLPLWVMARKERLWKSKCLLNPQACLCLPVLLKRSRRRLPVLLKRSRRRLPVLLKGSRLHPRESCRATSLRRMVAWKWRVATSTSTRVGGHSRITCTPNERSSNLMKLGCKLICY